MDLLRKTSSFSATTGELVQIYITYNNKNPRAVACRVAQHTNRIKHKQTAQAADPLPNATQPLGKIPPFTKIAATFDPMKRFRCLRRFRFSKKNLT